MRGESSLRKVSILKRSQTFTTGDLEELARSQWAWILRSLGSCIGFGYRHTSEILKVQFQTTTIKQVAICLLVEDLAYNL